MLTSTTSELMQCSACKCNIIKSMAYHSTCSAWLHLWQRGYCSKSFVACSPILIRHNIMTSEVNNADKLFIMAPVCGWDILGNKWPIFAHFFLKVDLLESGNWTSLIIWESLTWAEFWWPDSLVWASSKLHLLWVVPGMQWSISIENGPDTVPCSLLH